jgi:hypothetical protein
MFEYKFPALIVPDNLTVLLALFSFTRTFIPLSSVSLVNFIGMDEIFSSIIIGGVV